MTHSKLLNLAHTHLSRNKQYVATLADVELVQSKLDNVLPNIVDSYIAVTEVSTNEENSTWQAPTAISLLVCYTEEAVGVTLVGETETRTDDKHLIIAFQYNKYPIIYGEATITKRIATYLQEFFSTELEVETDTIEVNMRFMNTVNDHLTILKEAEHRAIGDTTFTKWTWQRVNDEHALFIRDTTDSVGCVNLDWCEDGTMSVAVYGKYMVSTVEEPLSLFDYIRNVIPTEKNCVYQKDDALGYMFEAISNFIEFKF